VRSNHNAERGTGRLGHPAGQKHSRAVGLCDDIHGFAAKPLPADDGHSATVLRVELVMNRDLSRLWMGSM
jgi:hypothetical protein